MTDTPSNRVVLNLPGAKPKVEVDGALGIVAKVLINGQRARPERGGWRIPLRKGGDGWLALRGYLPGFQRFEWQGEEVYKLGGHVGLPERIVLFAPFVLFVFAWFMVPVSLVLFFTGIPVAKNPKMPRALRIALPIVNTVAAFIALLAVIALLSNNT
ncbi:hypothetical protein LGT39_07025 [Demequina sp. TTPB684]|uniref:hypothetical protein n=1 Tax=unclassified Demequina TaxID=2620311 RepID=UPI001CF3C20B|nr:MULTISPECIES: hypothetical protein [unclassified Demequina]MCB2412601.1 hypothetical protein [Demequina sp. TTPB684]UPU89532.1 hypothetical protein LGT36_006290 [Demequina sp. TMPB413]